MTTKNMVIEKIKTSQFGLPIWAFMVLLLLAGCSGGSANWQHPSKPKNQWSADVSHCKSQASALIGRQLDIESDTNFQERNDLQLQFAAHDARKKRYSYFTNCLSGKGYRQITAP